MDFSKHGGRNRMKKKLIVVLTTVILTLGSAVAFAATDYESKVDNSLLEHFSKVKKEIAQAESNAVAFVQTELLDHTNKETERAKREMEAAAGDEKKEIESYYKDEIEKEKKKITQHVNQKIAEYKKQISAQH
jgi:predicted aconitase